jgi:hypothetical protein
MPKDLSAEYRERRPPDAPRLCRLRPPIRFSGRALSDIGRAEGHPAARVQAASGGGAGRTGDGGERRVSGPAVYNDEAAN